MKKKRINNITELASFLKLSVSTVSRVLNGKADTYRISKATQRRIIKAAKNFNYKPNEIARGLKLSRTETIGLIVPDIANPFFAEIVKSIENEVMKAGYMLLVCVSNEDIETEKELLLLLQSRRVDGMIIAPVGIKFSHIFNAHKSGLPVVIIDRIPVKKIIPAFTSDSYNGAIKAINYMVSIGHTRIGCICGMQGIYPIMERLKGYKAALLKCGIKYDSSLVSGSSFSIQTGYNETLRMMQLKNKPTAILALNNIIGLGVLKAASKLRIKIPDDLSLISFDEQIYSAFLSPSMTTMEQNKAGIGIYAVEKLLRLIENQESNDNKVKKLSMKLKKRGSVKPAI